MDNQVHYRTARQEALRKGLIAKLWAEARSRGWDKDELYEAVNALGKANAIYLYKYNWVGRGAESRVSLSSLKLWQLKGIVEAVCGERKTANSECAAMKPKANVIAREEWAR